MIRYKDEYFTIAESEKGVAFIQSGSEALVVALDANGHVLLTSEPTAAFAEEQTILLPGGTVDDGETPEQAANRELQEEIGYRAAQLTLIGEVRPWIKYLSTRTYLFLGRELRPATLVGDEDYAISLVRQPLDRFEALIEEGRLRDARVIAALYMAREFLRRQALGR